MSTNKLNNMSSVFSTEDGKTAQVYIPVDLLLILENLRRSLACRKKIDLIRNADR